MFARVRTGFHITPSFLGNVEDNKKENKIATTPKKTIFKTATATRPSLPKRHHVRKQPSVGLGGHVTDGSHRWLAADVRGVVGNPKTQGKAIEKRGGEAEEEGKGFGLRGLIWFGLGN